MIDDQALHDEAYQYCWQRRQIANRIHELQKIEREAEVAFYPFLDETISKIVLRLRDQIKTADKMWQWKEFDRAINHCNQIEGGIVELRSVARARGIMRDYCNRVLRLPNEAID